MHTSQRARQGHQQYLKIAEVFFAVTQCIAMNFAILTRSVIAFVT